MSRTLNYALVDVFAEQALEGNQLAIFTDATGLSTAEMQALARETNLSETTFILPRDAATEAREGVRVRIFSTDEEFPFAGHPTLGTSSWLHLHHPTLAGSPRITLALNVGPVPVDFTATLGAGVYGRMRQPTPVFGARYSPAEVAEVLGLQPHDLDPASAPQIVSTGMPFCIVLLQPEALDRLRIPQERAAPWLQARDAKFFYCLARDAGEHRFRARMQFYAGEDPATGSAAGCAIAYLVHHGHQPPQTPAQIRQGIEIHRPSHITAEASGLKGGSISDVFVSGRTVSVASGRFFLP